MDWKLVISRNRDLLLQIVASLLALAGLTAGGPCATLPRHIHRAIMLVLRPAESAVRRLIIIAARGLALKAPVSRPAPAGLGLLPHGGAARLPAFCLIDPLKRFTHDELQDLCGPPPRLSLPGFSDPVFASLPLAPSPDDPLDAGSIGQRLNALQNALNDVPRQARRLARWQARRMSAMKSGAPFKPMRLSPFRPGLPPGYRKRHLHLIDDVLGDCHHFALQARAADTS